MNALPTLMPTTVSDESYAGVTYHIDGELVPVLSVNVSRQSVYFEHHILLWKNSSVKIGVRPIKGAIKRMLAGMQVFVTEASGDGVIAFSRDGAGHIVPIHLEEGQELHVREHQFLAATSGVEYTYERVGGLRNMLFGKSGFFIDKFKAGKGGGILWLHGYGNVFEKELAAGETIDVEPGAWLFRSPGVKMETIVDTFTSGFLAAGGQIVVNRFTGPGRIGLQSMYVNLASDDK